MSLHINRFIDSIKSSEARGQRDLQISLRDAKDLHSDITKLLLTLEQLRDQNTAAAEPMIIEIQGGSFQDS
jgi:uncharacterized protein Smg (DUF494 family)